MVLLRRMVTWIRRHIFQFIIYILLCVGIGLYLDIPLWLSFAVNGFVWVFWIVVDALLDWLKGWHGSTTKTIISGSIRLFFGLLFGAIGAWNVYQLLYTSDFWFPLLGSVSFLLWSIYVLKLFPAICWLGSRLLAWRKRKKFEQTLERAKRGDVDAQLHVGEYYCYGEGVTRNSQQAISWFQQAAKQGSNKAGFWVGKVYCMYGDDEQGLAWYRKAANAGDEEAQYFLGMSLYSLYQDYRDWEDEYEYTEEEFQEKRAEVPAAKREEALTWYRKSAIQGYEEAQVDLGLWYWRRGADEEGEHWLQEAAMQGSRRGGYILADFYEEKGDFAKADLWRRRTLFWHPDSNHLAQLPLWRRHDIQGSIWNLLLYGHVWFWTIILSIGGIVKYAVIDDE